MTEENNSLNGSEMVEKTENWDTARLNHEDETLYIQTSNEYDQILARAQMSVVDEVDIEGQSRRIVGPSGCGKTTLARSLAFDIKIADALINDHDLPVWEMGMDELAVFHHIVMQSTEESYEMCPECESQDIYERKTKSPDYRCNKCEHEFSDPEIANDGSKNFLEEFEEVSDIEEELRDRNLMTASGDKSDNYPHSRAEMYREIYEVYDEPPYPSTPYFEVTMSHAKYAKDLIGHPHIEENGTTFVKGKVSNAVEASNAEPTVLTLDEINRAPTSAKDELYDALDGRVKVSMDEVGGVEIEGCPENLIIISTMNQGAGHHVEPIDFAEKRRLGSTTPVDFLGKEYPDKEIELVEQLTPIPEDLAAEMVKVANNIRATAEDRDTDVTYGVPTGTLIEWAEECYTNHLAGIDEPVVTAGEAAVAQAIYDRSEEEVQAVNRMIRQKMESVDFFNTPTEEDDSEENSGTESGINETRYVCQDDNGVGCSWAKPESEAPVEAVEFLVCPECGHEVDEVEPGQ